MTASTSAPTMAGSRSPRRGRRGLAELAPRRRGRPAQPAGQPVRGRPLQLADRLRGVRRVRRGHAGTAATCSPPPTAGALDQHHQQSAGRAGQQHRARSGRRRRRSTSAPMSARSSPTTVATTGKRSAPVCPKVAVWQLDYDATQRRPRAGTHGRGAYTLSNARSDPRSWSPRATTARRSARKHHPLHDHGAQHRQRRRHRRLRHRSRPAHTTVEQHRQRRLPRRPGPPLGPPPSRPAAA